MVWRLLIAFVGFAAMAALGAVFLLLGLQSAVARALIPLLLTFAAIPPAWLLARRFVRPFQELTDATYRIAEGEYSHRIPGGAWGESRSLARTFNTMSNRLEAQFQQLESDRHQLRTILGGMVEGVVALGPEQRVLFANEAAGQMLEFDPHQVVGRPIWEVTRLPQIQEVLAKAIRDTSPRREEFDWTGPTSRQLAIYVAPLTGDPAAPGAVLVLHDVTELRRLERLRQDFVANVSHELKTPLSVIKACIEALIDGAVEEPESRRPFLEQISDQGERLHALILDLISLARIESGEEILDFQAVPLEHAVADCLDRHQPRADAKRLSLRAVPAERDRGVYVMADDEALSQILDNLVDNAVKYTPEGGAIQVRWRSNGANVHLQVEDSGTGIPERDLARVFERFYRVDKARSRELGGTGLGLAIVKHLVQVMKGTVKATSQVGKGTTMTITLPRAE
jgi:two-component system, OmpR family, phosphate regulon sensor histidine kinase PhoR